MILELRLSNIFSFRDEMSLNLQAANIQTRKAQALKGNVFSIGGELTDCQFISLPKRPCSMSPQH